MTADTSLQFRRIDEDEATRAVMSLLRYLGEDPSRDGLTDTEPT